MFGKFYCRECNQIKPRYKVKCVDEFSTYGYYCKYCHNQVITVDDMLIRMNEELQKKSQSEGLDDLHKWIKAEAKEQYPDSEGKQKAFKAGIYALLDKIKFEY